MIKRLTILICALCVSVSNAATWYASVGGTSTNGSKNSTWSVEYAVGKTENPHLQPGDTVLFRRGTHRYTETNAPLSVAKCLEFHISGTPSEKITYRAEHLWDFHVDGGLLFPSTVSNLIVRDFHIYFSGATNRNSTNYTQFPNGISDFGPGNDHMHNLIENTGHPGIASWKTTRGKYIAGNIIRFVGIYDWELGGNARGSGMYLQNAEGSSPALIFGNISYFNFTTGMKAYGNTDIWGFNFTKNILAENTEAGIFAHQDDTGLTNVTIAGDYFWRNGTAIRIGYTLGNGSPSGAMVVTNYAVDDGYGSYPFYQADGWTGNTVRTNVFVSLLNRYPLYFEKSGETDGDIASHDIDRNTYYTLDSGGFGSGPFFIKEADYTFAAWQAAVLGDTNSAHIYAYPLTNSAFIIRPSTDPAFANVVVFNWTNALTTTVDLTGYFRKGERLAVFDVQNIPQAFTNLSSFGGGTLSLDLTLTNLAVMLGGTFAGFDARFRAFVVYAEPEPVINVTSASVGSIVLAP